MEQTLPAVGLRLNRQLGPRAARLRRRWRRHCAAPTTLGKPTGNRRTPRATRRTAAPTRRNASLRHWQAKPVMRCLRTAARWSRAPGTLAALRCG